MQFKSFIEVFNEWPDGSLSPKVRIDVGGVAFGPGTSFQKGVVFGGVDFHLYKGRDIAVETQQDGVLRILGFKN